MSEIQNFFVFWKLQKTAEIVVEKVVARNFAQWSEIDPRLQVSSLGGLYLINFSQFQ